MSTRDTCFVQNDNALIMTWLKYRRFFNIFRRYFHKYDTQIHVSIHAARRGEIFHSQILSAWILCHLYKHFIMREFWLMKTCFCSITSNISNFIVRLRLWIRNFWQAAWSDRVSNLVLGFVSRLGKSDKFSSVILSIYSNM